MEGLLPAVGSALDVACGQGRCAVWLASIGLEVWGLDISPVAVHLARGLARAAGLAERCRFDVVDLDDGLPAGVPVDLIVCQCFRDPRLDRILVERLAPRGLLAISALSEVDVAPGPYRIPRGELPRAFSELELLDAGERGGVAWLLGRRVG